jgi:hypothetical protein
MAGQHESVAIAVGEPSVVVNSTTSQSGRWISSRTIDAVVHEGAAPVTATLRFPYRDAASETEAFAQVVPALDAVIAQLSRTLGRLRSDDE